MGNKWPLIKLEDCMDAIIDYRGKTPRKISAGVPLITAKIVKDGKILPVGEYISEEDYDAWMRRGMPKKGDVLLTTEAPLGEIAQLDGRKIALAQRVITLRGKEGFLDNRFLKYLMLSNCVQRQLIARATGTTVLGIKQSELRKIELPIPEINEQRAIAYILGSIDDKIELNCKMNETLEAMAQSLFKSWFVDFDPVIDNALAAGKPIPNELKGRAEQRKTLGKKRKSLPKEIQKLFPVEFVKTDEMRWVPKGWSCGYIRDIADNPRRGVKAKDISVGIPYIGLQDMPQKCISLSSWGRSEDIESGKYSFKRGEILFGKLRPYFHKVGIAPKDGVCSTDILVVVPKNHEWFSVVLGHITSVEFIEYVTGASTGTRMPRTNWQDMGKYRIVLPPRPLADFASSNLRDSVNRILFNIDETRELTKIRDTLLPKLISGDLQISEEKIMEKI